MKKGLLILFALVLMNGAEAQTKFSARTLKIKKQQETAMQQARRAGKVVEPMVDCFIKFSAPCAEELKALGVKPQVVMDNVMTAQMPVSAMNQVAQLEQVTYVEVSTPMQENTDKARKSTDAYKVLHEGVSNGLSQNYDGTGVIIGVVDDGVDFQHPALRTSDGHSRCSMVYMPCRKYVAGKGGEQAKSGENVLNGVVYKKQEELDSLTTDLYGESHGTHTVATAAGREIGEYGGVAPGAELIVAALNNNLANTNVINAMKLMADYAKEKGKRLVISKSLGLLLGPHDGTSAFNNMLRGIVKDKNVIVCQAAGNSGDTNCYVHFTKDSLRTVTIDGKEHKYWAIVAVPWARDAKEKNVVTMSASVWCDGKTPFDLSVLTYSEKDGLEIDEFVSYEKFVTEDHFSMNYVKDNKDSLEVYGVVNKNNGHYNVSLDWTLNTKKNSKYLDEGSHIGLMFFPRDENQEMHLWLDDDKGHMLENHYVTKNPQNLVLMTGDSSLSADDDCCLDSVINIGNYVSKASYITLDGKEHPDDDDNYPGLGEISTSSGYGTTLNGIIIPTVCGPGTTIIAAVNHYDDEYNSNKTSTKVEEVNGVNYYWGPMSGTSMSTPHVAGIIAQWLQANKTLTIKDIMAVLKDTSYSGHDHDKERWGQYGRIEALKGIKKVLETTDIRDLQAEQALDAHVDVYNLNGQLVRSNVTSSEAVNGLPTGVYVVNGRKVVVK